MADGIEDAALREYYVVVFGAGLTAEQKALRQDGSPRQNNYDKKGNLIYPTYFRGRRLRVVNPDLMHVQSGGQN